MAASPALPSPHSGGFLQNNHHRRMLLLLLLLISLISTTHSHTPPLEYFVYGGCSASKYDKNSPYLSNLNSLLSSLVNSATYSSYNHYTVMGPSGQPTDSTTVNGLYQCRGDLSMPDCATCVAHAAAQMSAMCPSTYGASLQLVGCYLKYDNQQFFGVEDKTVVKKKFGSSIELDGEKMAGRDAVFDGLMNASGGYRVAGSKDVQGVGQCVGDLSGDQCQDCVVDAVKRLKSECGSSGYGDVFLAKCYVRFSFDGAGGYYKFTNGGSSSSTSSITKGIDMKMFALIAGCLAGIVLLVIFFTFVCRSFGGGGK